MRIKRTYGATMREALAQVKLEQGPDAVILGNKKVPGGVEILSAIDFDHRQVDAYAGDPGLGFEQGGVLAQTEPESASRQASVQATSELQSMNALPDFIVEQGDGDRKEPVLGMASTAKSSSSPAVSKVVPLVSKTGSNEAPVPKKPKNQPIKKAAASRPKPARKAAKPAKASLPVEEEAKARASQADRLLQSLRQRDFPDSSRSEAENQDSQLIDAVRGELKQLRDLMEGQLNVLEWDNFNQRHPVRSVLLNLMNELGLGPDVCELVFNKLGTLDEDPHKVWQRALGIVASALPIATTDVLNEGGRIALVGSTGVGKTTTIAKLAARFAQTHGKRSVALISTDNFRIGALEQLQQFARMLEVPLLTANSSDELSDRLTMLSDKQLVLIDTAGMSQTDVRLSEQFHKLQHGSPEIQPYLVLSANTQQAALNDTVRNFERVKLAGAFVTKIDESASLGGVITTAIRHRIPLAYCGTGQRVPEDLQQAKSHRLVSRAVALMQNHTQQIDKETLAFRYNHIITRQKG